MATAKSFAQHFIECENCEENPAQFLCKTCPGHLCQTCKTEHEMKKITKNHEVIHLHRNRESSLGLLFCAKHTTNKLEWYCSPCKEPVCTKCHIESHNGHKMEELASTYKRIISKLKQEKEKILGAHLPKFKELLSEEKTKKIEISKRTCEVQKQIEEHTKSIIEQVTMMKENAIQNLLEEERKAMNSVEKSECEIERRIERLEKINEEIDNDICASPGIPLFKKTESKLCEDVQEFSSAFDYKLDNFEPGDIVVTEHQFGKTPKYTISKQNNLKAGGCSNELSKKEEALIQEIEHLKLRQKCTKIFFTRALLQSEIQQRESKLSELRLSHF